MRGDEEDPFSRGFICPKAHGLKELYHDPDRLRRPVRRTADGWQEICWDEAYEEVATRLLAIREQHGNDAIGMYTGNPVVHDLGALLYRPVLRARAREQEPVQLLGDRHAAEDRADGPHVRAATSRPAVPVPDIDRTQLPADHRREPDGLARQPDDDARRARPPEAA